MGLEHDPNQWGEALHNPVDALDRPELALPGPHPHQAEDARNHGGSHVVVPDGYDDGTGKGRNKPTVPTEVAAPGPSPHEAADAHHHGGDAWRPGGSETPEGRKAAKKLSTV